MSSFSHHRPSGSSQPYTQPDPIIIDDDDDDIVFTGISHSPPTAHSAAAPLPTSGPSVTLPHSSRDRRDIQASGALADATANVHLEPQAIRGNGTVAPSQSISPAMIGGAASKGSTAPTATYGTESSSSSSDSSRSLSPRERYPTGLVYDVLMMLHANPVEIDHPEDPIRIHKIFSLLQQHGCVARMKRIPTREVLKDEVMLIHEAGIWDGLERSAEFGRDELAEQTNLLERLDSLYVNEHSALAARISCGGAIELCDAIASGRIHNGFAIIRPPGHHAEPTKSMGFCFYNNVAVATRFLQQKYREGEKRVKKVLILDWDVHHGNGTQKAFEDDADVLYISLHRYEDGVFYPGGTYGGAESVGSGAGTGRSVNIPWPCAGMGDGDYLHAFDQVVMPIAREFGPDFVIISAGFDAAEGDSIGLNLVTPVGYALMTHALASLAEGRLAVILEGGYNPDAIAQSALEVTKIILREPPPRPKQQRSVTQVQQKAAEAVRGVVTIQSRFWSSLKPAPMYVDDAAGMPRLPLSDLLRAHRAYELHKRYQFYEIPIEEKIHNNERGQALASEDVMKKETVVLFAHDMGNIRADPPALNTTCQRELAYIVDSSTKVLDWAYSKGYGIIDVNVLQQLPDESVPAYRYNPKAAKNSPDHVLYGDVSRLITYLYDNLIQLSEAKNLILIGHGLATMGIKDLIIDRPQVRRQTAAVIMVLGLQTIPQMSPGDTLLRKWYWQRSKVITPGLHAIWLDPDGPAKRMGRVEASPENKAVKVLSASFDDIATFVEARLRKHVKSRNDDLDV
ncbi:uncharacterized protein PFL1_03625 [Pseudozyma flocculosa PF-1]|uniref:histone deacetylase n=2 Tax=Pseudozyma flocculosa TaxID=84751 RepID=A0A5C3F4I6_9BASI|nr:uncharacterized protein PFL1_03625 [Pseudozyma flocculosa PF-1]EPQ28822.1 hypothetical protein PFL1_03625 [Pseudozyma flocculosa PF-1]SPO39388.1 related to HDA1 - histone deacetylase A [Pseudozyma flocculosa]